ncbi:hypothetical protein PUN28_002481 [Cardiocondyla obscurior]|uniref:Uncharacterized protein n=1 Tax=Cardiocondyla obscurior TaxID=286306 RepID=A0AAW2GUD2_9HYME
MLFILVRNLCSGGVGGRGPCPPTCNQFIPSRSKYKAQNDSMIFFLCV